MAVLSDLMKSRRPVLCGYRKDSYDDKNDDSAHYPLTKDLRKDSFCQLAAVEVRTCMKEKTTLLLVLLCGVFSSTKAQKPELVVQTSHTDKIVSLAFTADGSILASGSRDSTVKLWDTKTGHELRTLRGHSKVVNALAFSFDGRWLASGSRDETIRVWNVESGQEIFKFYVALEGVEFLAFSPDGRRLVSAAVND